MNDVQSSFVEFREPPWKPFLIRGHMFVNRLLYHLSDELKIELLGRNSLRKPDAEHLLINTF